MSDLVKELRDAPMFHEKKIIAMAKEAADRIEQLERENNEHNATRERANQRAFLLEAKLEQLETESGFKERKARIEELARENAELRRDAERYQWIRENDRDVLCGPYSTAEYLDAAIDAAMNPAPYMQIVTPDNRIHIDPQTGDVGIGTPGKGGA